MSNAQTSTTVTQPNFLRTDGLNVRGEVAIVDSTVTDSGASPTSSIRAGNVIKKVSGGQFVQANSATAALTTAAAITSSSHTDDASNAIVIVGPRGTVSVTMSTGSGTETQNAVDLNADPQFAAFYTASAAASELTITANVIRDGEWLYVDATTHANFGFAEGVANEVKAVGPDYRVVRQTTSLLDGVGTAVDTSMPTLLAGHFDLSELINCTGEAQEILATRGSKFD
jgi:hypothetical protein